MKIIIGLLFIIIGVAGALYISIWWGIIQPIYSICQMVDAHSISAMNIAGEVVKFIVRDILAVIWFAIFWLIGSACINN